MDIVKDRLYTFAAASSGRRAAQSTLLSLLDTLVRLMAPVLSYTADEIWSFMPARESESVFEAGFAPPDPSLDDEEMATRWEGLLRARGVVTKVLEEARQAGDIGHPLDARVTLSAGDGTHSLLEAQGDLAAFFIVSQVEIGRGSGSEDLEVRVEPARGEKCERCWNFSEAVGRSAAHPSLCERCVPVLESRPESV
jgi:isoleucyl-tRNA synthetase